MTFYNFLSVLGALAWFPPTIILFKNILLKPNLSIISHKELEIGYTLSGPIINLNLAFSAENKEVLIKRIDIILRHQNNETHLFSWDWFEEQLLQIDTPDQGSMPFRKNQKAIAIKILKESLVEKKIGFLNNQFRERYFKLFGSINEVHNNYIQSGQDKNNIKTTKEYNNLADHFKNLFIWKVGKYSVNIKIYITKSTQPFEHDINFQLTSLDIKNLEINIKTCQDILEKVYIVEDPDFKPNWKWITPYKIAN